MRSQTSLGECAVILRDDYGGFFGILGGAHDGAGITNERWERPANAVVLRTSE